MPVVFHNLRHLRAFREVARYRSISTAAGHVHLSQPAITQAISGLEGRLGTPLFERSSKGMFLTGPGELFAARVTRMLAQLDTGIQVAMRLTARGKGRPAAGAVHVDVTATQLRALVAIAEVESFSIAAHRNGISQPALHRAARDLETRLGIALFVAKRRGTRLTPAAELLARAVKLASAELCQGFDEVAHYLGRDNSRISVGAMPLSRSAILPEAIHGLFARTPSAQVLTVEGPYGELLRALRHGDLDFLIGALRNPSPADDVVQERLFDDSLVLVAGSRHPLATKRGVRIEDTLAFPWVAPPKATPSGRFLFNLLRIGTRAQTPVRVVSSSMAMVRGLLARGAYLTIMSLGQITIERRLGLIVPLDIDLPDSKRPIGLTMRANWRPTPTQAYFLDLIRTAAAQNRDHGNGSRIDIS